MNYIYKKYSIGIILFLAFSIFSSAQVGIGRNNPRGVLDVNNSTGTNTMGVVFPKTDNVDNIVTPDGGSPVEATMVYDTNDHCLKYVKQDGSWSSCLLDERGVKQTTSDILSLGSEFKIRQVSLGTTHTLAIGYDDRALYVSGSNATGRTGIGRLPGYVGSFMLMWASPVRDVSAGIDHSIMVTGDELIPIGEVWTWGNNAGGRTGLGIIATNTSLPAKVDGFGHEETYGPAIQVEAGESMSFVLTEKGEVYSAGINTGGRTGLGTTAGNTINFTRVSVNTNPGDKVVQISAALQSCAALTESGEVFVWGYGANGRLGTGVTTNETLPRSIPMPLSTPIKKVAMGAVNGAAISKDGKQLFAWGWNVGFGTGPANQRSTPTEITNLIPGFDSDTDEFIDVIPQRFGGTGSLIVITSKGTYVTGFNPYGKLGTGHARLVVGFEEMKTRSAQNGTVFLGGDNGLNQTILITGENNVVPSSSHVAYGMGYAAVPIRLLGAIIRPSNVPIAILK